VVYETTLRGKKGGLSRKVVEVHYQVAAKKKNQEKLEKSGSRSSKPEFKKGKGNDLSSVPSRGLRKNIA